MRRGRRSSAPPAATSERVASGMPSLAPLAATIRSQASAISSPPATANPSIAAISGLSAGFLAISAKPPAPAPGPSPGAHALRALPPPEPLPSPALAPPPGPLAGRERLQVHARAEALALAGDHPDAELVGGVELVQRGSHRLGHRQVDRVPGVGAVQGDQQDAVSALGEQWLLVHEAGPYN